MYLGKPQVTTEDVFQIVEEEQNQATVFWEIANTTKIYNSKDSTVIAKIADNLF